MRLSICGVVKGTDAWHFSMARDWCRQLNLLRRMWALPGLKSHDGRKSSSRVSWRPLILSMMLMGVLEDSSSAVQPDSMITAVVGGMQRQVVYAG